MVQATLGMRRTRQIPSDGTWVPLQERLPAWCPSCVHRSPKAPELLEQGQPLSKAEDEPPVGEDMGTPPQMGIWESWHALVGGYLFWPQDHK